VAAITKKSGLSEEMLTAEVDNAVLAPSHGTDVKHILYQRETRAKRICLQCVRRIFLWVY